MEQKLLEVIDSLKSKIIENDKIYQENLQFLIKKIKNRENEIDYYKTRYDNMKNIFNSNINRLEEFEHSNLINEREIQRLDKEKKAKKAFELVKKKKIGRINKKRKPIITDTKPSVLTIPEQFSKKINSETYCKKGFVSFN